MHANAGQYGKYSKWMNLLSLLREAERKVSVGKGRFSRALAQEFVVESVDESIVELRCEAVVIVGREKK